MPKFHLTPMVIMTLLSSTRLVSAFVSQPGKRLTSSSSSFKVFSKSYSPSSSALHSTKDETTANTETTPEVIVPRKFKPFPFQYREELILKVDSLTNRGIGVCRATIPPNAVPADENQRKTFEKDDSKWVVFVPNTIPGETVRCWIYRNHGSYSDADLLEVIDKHPQRVEALCPLAEECGGCQYQHMHVDVQREWKTSQVQELLERIGNLDPASFPPTRPTVGTDEVYHYRSKITPHYDRPIKSDIGDMKIRAIGFKKKANRQIVDVPYCHIATERINEKLTEYRKDKQLEAQEGRLKRPKKGATLLLRDALEYTDDLTVDTPVVETDHNVYVKTKVKDLQFRFLAGNFFQNNPFMLPIMVDDVVEAAIKPSASGERMTHLVDCYCGSGLFCLSASKSFDLCVGIEIVSKAVEEAQFNAELNSISNCKFVAASAEAIFMSKDPVEVVTKDESGNEVLTSTLVKDFPTENTVVVIDPPRKGCSEEFLDQLYKFGPQRCVYMSCDPATQARDAEGIVAAGYEIVSVQPYDLFPQTRHIESLIVFEKIAK